MVKLNKLKQIREMMKAKKSLSAQVVEGQSLGGQIKIRVDGTQAITSLNIDPGLLSPGNQEKIESGIKAAHKDALKQLQKIMVAKVKSGDLQLPDLGA